MQVVTIHIDSSTDLGDKLFYNQQEVWSDLGAFLNRFTIPSKTIVLSQNKQHLCHAHKLAKVYTCCSQGFDTKFSGQLAI